MQLKGIVKTLTLAFAVTAPAAFAGHAPSSNAPYPIPDIEWDNVLSEHGKWNKNLDAGEYTFAAIHESNGKSAGKSFFDEWSFTLADSGNVTINLFDLALPGGENPLYPNNWNGGKYHKELFSSLLDNKFLTVSLFDQEGLLLGTAGENGTLSALGLTGGNWYTLTVSGKAAGLLGGIYYGSMDVAPVPIGDTLPLFASALLVGAWRLRKNQGAKKQQDTNQPAAATC